MRRRVKLVKELKIAKRVLSPINPYFIAEIGSNHCGERELAIESIRSAKAAGADAVKFQLFRWEDILIFPKGKDPRFELPPSWLPALRAEAVALGLGFLCTPFASWAVGVLDPFVDAWKIGSFEARYWPLIAAIPKDDRPRLISFGMTKLWPKPMRESRDVFLHCVSKYPTAFRDAAVTRLQGIPHPKGYSSHTAGWEDVLAAIVLGACVIEKHFIHPKARGEGSPDDGPWSLAPDDFASMVEHGRVLAECLPWRNKETAVERELPMGRKLFGK